MSSLRRDQAIQNFDTMRSRGRFQAEYARLDASFVCELLEQTKHAVRTQATHLLEEMARQRWWLCADPHTGGHGPTPDRALHFNIKLPSERQIHVRLRKNGAGAYFVHAISRL